LRTIYEWFEAKVYPECLVSEHTGSLPVQSIADSPVGFLWCHRHGLRHERCRQDDSGIAGPLIGQACAAELKGF
jgi:hypothetical protein